VIFGKASRLATHAATLTDFGWDVTECEGCGEGEIGFRTASKMVM
jgi:hypothetical protein